METIITVYMVRTTITIDVNLRERMRKLGEKGETYDMIIEKLLNFWNGKGGKK